MIFTWIYWCNSVTDAATSCSNEKYTKCNDARSNSMRGWSVLGMIRRTVCDPVLHLFEGCNLSLSSAIVFQTYTLRAEFQTVVGDFVLLFQCFAEMTVDCENNGQNWNIRVYFCFLFCWERGCHVMVLILSVEKYLCSVPSLACAEVFIALTRETQKLQVFLHLLLHISQLPYWTKFVFVNISE